MSFTGYKDIIESGDLVLAYISRNDIKPLVATPGEVLNTRYGSFPHSSMIGKKFGTQIPSQSKFGFIHLLHPTAELWTLSLPHRTQIVYTSDSSYIMQRMKVLPGSIVVEAGTGSGSFSHAFARTVAPTGKLYTYEFHEPRFIEAKKEFTEHKLTDIITITHRDVCEDGFEIPGTDVQAEAVFLDLPSPWAAIPKLNTVINKKVKVSVCCFSPCIEQVSRTVEALQKHGWTCIEMVEISGKKWDARKELVKTLDNVMDRLREVNHKKEEGLRKRNERIAKLKAEGVDDSEIEKMGDLTPTEPEKESTPEKNTNGKRPLNPAGEKRVKEGDRKFEWKNVSRVEPEIKSHTSFLTFAVKLPTEKFAPLTDNQPTPAAE